jgi:hypothetical protein
MTKNLAAGFRYYADLQARRVLTQLDRDPDSPTYGCFDRNYWHYKVRDYPSSILQQAVAVLGAAYKGYVDLGANRRRVLDWSIAAINALSRQVRSSGAVDEYYPHEESYPAAAFSLYGVTRTLWEWKREDPRLLDRIDWRGLRRLAAGLSERRELQASNQYAAGVAALALGLDLPQLGINPARVAAHASRLLELQHDEGWFPEYGGPDFGYLSVTLDALVDYWEATGDERALRAAHRAVDFVAKLVGADGQLPWTLNSRNTDYFVPYGLTRLGARDPAAAWLLETLFSRLTEARHFLWATDDRYCLHYVFASVVRGLPHLEAVGPREAPAPETQVYFPGCGHWAAWSPDRRHTLYVGAHKGGLVRLHSSGAETAVDHGWRVRQGSTVWTNNWWSEHWTVKAEPGAIKVEGNLFPSRYRLSTPIAHVTLRVMAWLFGRRIIPVLKRLLIFRRRGESPVRFEREVKATGNGFCLTDLLVARRPATATPAPRQNLRHVASGDSFHVEDLAVPILGEDALPLSPRGTRSIDWQYDSPDGRRHEV